MPKVVQWDAATSVGTVKWSDGTTTTIGAGHNLYNVLVGYAAAELLQMMRAAETPVPGKCCSTAIKESTGGTGGYFFF
ncbi:hypothetical protein Slin14017_G087840 [Septoria linicola]|nr:hypothetical protein Slin14017_G087840 [Septoria linicola]